MRPCLDMRLLSLAVALVVVACSTPPPSPTATEAGPVGETETLWGFTPFPSAPTDEAVGASFEFVAEEGDLVAHHFDGTIPWSHLLRGEPLPDDLSAELTGRAAFDDAHPELTVYVATALTNLERTGIPGPTPGEVMPDVADSFADPEVRRALSGWVDLLVDRFDPTYLNVGVEIDMYAANRRDDWESLLSLYEEIYQHVKETNEDIVVFASFQAELGEPSVLEPVAASSDLVGVSTYPYFAADGVPGEDYLDRYAAIGLPVVLAETGFPAAEVMSPRGPVTSDLETQANYVAWLGRMSAEHDLGFVVWFLPFDIDAFVGRPGVSDSVKAFSHLGLVDRAGNSRPSLDQWRDNRSAG